jgi:hypothetical protein
VGIDTAKAPSLIRGGCGGWINAGATAECKIDKLPAVPVLSLAFEEDLRLRPPRASKSAKEIGLNTSAREPHVAVFAIRLGSRGRSSCTTRSDPVVSCATVSPRRNELGRGLVGGRGVRTCRLVLSSARLAQWRWSARSRCREVGAQNPRGKSNSPHALIYVTGECRGDNAVDPVGSRTGGRGTEGALRGYVPGRCCHSSHGRSCILLVLGGDGRSLRDYLASGGLPSVSSTQLRPSRDARGVCKLPNNGQR